MLFIRVQWATVVNKTTYRPDEPRGPALTTWCALSQCSKLNPAGSQTSVFTIVTGPPSSSILHQQHHINCTKPRHVTSGDMDAAVHLATRTRPLCLVCSGWSCQCARQCAIRQLKENVHDICHIWKVIDVQRPWPLTFSANSSQLHQLRHSCKNIRLRNDLNCVEWDVKPCSTKHSCPGGALTTILVFLHFFVLKSGAYTAQMDTGQTEWLARPVMHNNFSNFQFRHFDVSILIGSSKLITRTFYFPKLLVCHYDSIITPC